MRKVSKPVKVEFYTKAGKKFSFKGCAKITKPIKVKFYNGRDNKTVHFSVFD